MTSAFPDWLEPMAATLTQDRFTGPAWRFERKFDGMRVLAFKRGTSVRLLSRNRLPQQLPAVAQAIAALPPHELILDGEVTWGALAYHVFDILWLDGRNLTALPLDARRQLLDDLPLTAPLDRVPAVDHPEPWTLARHEGWEGVIAKRRDSPYEHRRSRHWLKMKCERTQALVVGGYTDPRGSRVGLGALLLGYYEGRDLVFAGRVGTGFDTALLRSLRHRLGAATIASAPFTRAVGLPRRGAHWVRPELVVEVGFIEWTAHGKLRHARLLQVCPEIDGRTVRRGPA